MENSKFKLVLASASPRRKELLGHLKLPFEIRTLNVPEESSFQDPRSYCLEIARLKGKAVFDDLTRVDRNLFVVSADTIVCLGNKIYGKPSDVEEARSFLTQLAGKTHSVFTAVVVHIQHSGKDEYFSFVEESKVSFVQVKGQLLDNYLATGDSLDKAGAYGIQGPSLTFIDKVEGCYANVVGFPLSRFIQETKHFFMKKFPQEKSWFELF